MSSELKQLTISELMSELDHIALAREPDLGREDWRPQSPEGKRIFKQLIASDNRQTLRQWYANLRGVPLNHTAKMLKASLESAIGEKLD